MADGTPKVIEFNCRFGDPETQPIMLRLQSDLVSLCLKACEGDLADTVIEFDQRAAVGVVLAAGGYPGAYNKGDKIEGLAQADQLPGKVFHAGTALQAENKECVLTNGGRVLCATALGDTVLLAQQAAYAVANTISWAHVMKRSDIAYRAITREQAN